MSFDNNPIKVSYENIDSNDKLVSFKIPIHYDGSDKDFGVELYNITNTKNSITVRN